MEVSNPCPRQNGPNRVSPKRSPVSTSNLAETPLTSARRTGVASDVNVSGTVIAPVGAAKPDGDATHKREASKSKVTTYLSNKSDPRTPSNLRNPIAL